MKVHLGHATSGEVVVGETRQALLGAFGQKFDRRVGGVHEQDRAGRELFIGGA
jgi:hypothetical protein